MMNPIPKFLGALACCTLLWAATPARADDAGTLRAAIIVERARTPAPQYPRTAFDPSRALQSVRLSPDGRFVAYLRQQGEQRSLWLLPTGGGAARQLLPRTEADELHWSRDGRWLFVKARRSLVTMAIEGRAGVRIPLDNPRALIRVDPSQPAAVVLRERVRTPTGDRWPIVRRDAHGRRTLLRQDDRFIHDVAFDERGRLVALLRFDGDHDALYRVDAAGGLRELTRWTTIRDQAELLAAPQGELLLSSDAGGNFRRVLRVDRAGVLHTVHADPRGEADLDKVVLDPVTQQPAIVSYRSTVAATYGLGAAQSQVAAITKRFPGRDVGISIGHGSDAHWLVSERASALRDAKWHLYDPRTGRIRRILEQDAKMSTPVPETALARKLPFAYSASDGMRVRGFLLLPPGADPARVPLVASVHGGPINHFRADDYDGIAQLLVNRGFAVFQSNFRGSTGHGRDYALAPHGDYGNGRVQQDIVEGVRWLLAQGIGDPQRVGIVGHSFGGYSTLLGVTFTPELFKVGVAGAPPADFGWSMQWLHEFGGQGARPDRSLAASMRLLGLDVDDAASYAHLRAQSPLANAGKLRRPLLLLAGGEDRTVPIREVINYAAVLRRLGKDVSLYVEPNGEHSPTEPLPREAYVYLMEAMLHRHLGGRKPEAPSAALRDYLQKSLKLTGRDIEFLPKR